MTPQQRQQIVRMDRQGYTRLHITLALGIKLTEIHEVTGKRYESDYGDVARRECRNIPKDRGVYEHARIVWCNFSDVCSLAQCIEWCEESVTKGDAA